MARSQRYTFGPGSLERLELRVWARNGTFGDVLCARLSGLYNVYCGHGNEHTTDIMERAEITRTRPGDISSDLLACWTTELRETRDPVRSEDLADSIARYLLEYALDEWADPCEVHDCSTDGARVCFACEELLATL